MPLLTDSMAASESALFFAERVVKVFVKTLSMLFCNGKKCKKKNSIDRGHRLIYATCPNHDIKTSFRVLIGT